VPVRPQGLCVGHNPSYSPVEMHEYMSGTAWRYPYKGDKKKNLKKFLKFLENFEKKLDKLVN
jgi:hypothetical protein